MKASQRLGFFYLNPLPQRERQTINPPQPHKCSASRDVTGQCALKIFHDAAHEDIMT
jgi:hypothetical protein